MDRYDSRTSLVDSIEQALAHPAVDAETLGRTVLMLEWFIESGVLDAEDVARLLAERMDHAYHRTPAGHDGGAPR